MIFAGGAVLMAVAVGALMVGAMIRRGLSAADQPTSLEAMLARSVRTLAVPSDLKRVANPVALSPAVLAEARAHFADHCALCHGNDGKGSEMGKKMYPPAPDMTLQQTQEQSDGALFATIENGVRLTGMPAFGDGSAESAYQSWTLVHFVRHLPRITAGELAEMERLNPKSPDQYEQMKREEAFLAGEEVPEVAPPAHH